MSPEQAEKLKDALLTLIDIFDSEIDELKKRVEALEKKGTDIKSVRFI